MSFADTGYHVSKISVDTSAIGQQSSAQSKENASTGIVTAGWGKAPIKVKSISFSDIIEEEKDIDAEAQAAPVDDFYNYDNEFPQSSGYRQRDEEQWGAGNERTVTHRENQFYDDGGSAEAPQPVRRFVIGGREQTDRPPHRSQSAMNFKNQSEQPLNPAPVSRFRIGGNTQQPTPGQQPTPQVQYPRRQQPVKSTSVHSFTVGSRFQMQNQTEAKVTTTTYVPPNQK